MPETEPNPVNVVAVSRLVRVTTTYPADERGEPIGYVDDSEPPAETAAPPKTKCNTSVPFDRHYTCAEIAELWNVSPDFVRDLFRDEPGVLSLERTGTKKYTTYRIPESVMRRVYAEKVRRC
jgi:hypothetical protein